MIEVCLLTFLAKDSATAENTHTHTTQDTCITATACSIFHVLYRTTQTTKSLMTLLFYWHSQKICKFLNTSENLLTHVELLPYSGKLSREKTFRELVKIQFSQRKLSRIARFCRAKGCHTPNFMKKTFAYSPKLRNSRKFSPSKVFCYMVWQDKSTFRRGRRMYHSALPLWVCLAAPSWHYPAMAWVWLRIWAHLGQD